MENMEKYFTIRNGRVSGLSEKMGVTLSQEAYDALSDEKKNDGTIYFIPDGDGEIGIQDTIVSENSVWSSQKVSDEIDAVNEEIEKKEDVYITDSAANLLYYAGEYLGVNVRGVYGIYHIEVTDATGHSAEYKAIYKHEALIYVQVISENGFTLTAVNNGGTFALYNCFFKVKHIGVCEDAVATTLGNNIITRVNSNALASQIVGTKTQYRGSRSIDITTGGKLTLIFSSEYASQAGCYMLLSNFNTKPLLIELGRNNIGQFSVTATHKSQNVDTITVTTAGDEYSWCVLQF